MFAPTDPIVAVSSPPGRGPRGIVRASADHLAPILRQLLDPPPPPRQLTPTRLRLHSTPKAHGWPSVSFPPRPAPAITLPCLALFHPAPHSFTTQDVLELQAPANPALLERILQTLLAALREHTGAGRLAEPGEFTQRAFTAGRIDLTRAEGVAATISAVCDAQLQAARLLRTGRLGSWSTDLVDQLAQLLALVEAGIDFVDQDDVVPITPAALDDGLSAIERQLEQLLHRSRSWSTLESLPWVVLVGPPNAGKSTLFNALLGHPRAVTSNIPGTTRDILTEPLRIPDPKNPHQSAEVMLVDVAGLDQPSSLSHLPSPNRKSKIENRKSPHPPSPISHPPISDALDDAMQSAAQDAIHRADLILQLQTDPPPPNRQSPIANRKSPSPIPILHLQTKSDLHPPATRTPANPADLHVSAVTGEGLGELRRRIADALSDRAVTLSGQMLALQPRHHDELHASLQATREARAMLTHQRDRHALLDMELIAGHMRRALDHLGALGGQMTPDDVIGKVFSTFCIGK